MTECSICGRGGAMTGSPMRYCQGHCLCARCWDGIPCAVLGHAPSAEAESVNGYDAEAAWVKPLLAEVARNSRR